MGSETKLSDFLQRGLVIRTKHCEDPNWVTNVVYGFNDESIEIDLGLEKDYLDNIIMIGDTMKCKYTTNQFEYTIFGWVTRINLEFPQSITIRVHQIEVFDNNRNSYRYDVYLSSVIKLVGGDNKGIFAILTNISATGVAFVIREDIGKMLNFNYSTEPNKHILVEIYISPDRTLLFKGELVRSCNKDKGIEYGVRIIDMDLDNEKLLNEFINELAIRDKEFYNKRSSFWSKNGGINA